jgi:hypothetical protein
MSIEIEDILQCIEKEYGLTVNCANRDGSIFENWLQTYHPTGYLYPIVQACGGSRQDLRIDGTPVILMNLPFYLQFMHWCLSIGISSVGILQHKLFILLLSTEVVALLLVLSILDIAVCLPARWLAGNATDLGHNGYSYYDMGFVLVFMEDMFDMISNDHSVI